MDYTKYIARKFKSLNDKFRFGGHYMRLMNGKMLFSVLSTILIFKLYRIYNLQIEKDIYINVLNIILEEQANVISNIKTENIITDTELNTQLLSSEDRLRLTELFEVKKPDYDY